MNGLNIKGPNRLENIPVNAERSYKNRGWISWIDFLGNEGRKKKLQKNGCLFKDARQIVRGKNFKARADFRKWHTKTQPSKIPYDRIEFIKIQVG